MKLHAGKRFGGTQDFVALTDDSHTPENKRPGEVQSRAVLGVSTSAAGGWVEVRLSEMTTTDSGRTAERAISMTIHDRAAICALIAALQGALE